jgi:hypothetical protein
VARDVEQVQAGPAEAGQDGDGPRRRPLGDRLQLWALVELFVLCGFAIAQPLLDVTGRSPEFFLFRRADRLDIVALALGLLLLPALGIWTAEVLTGLVSERGRRYLHLAAVAGLVALVAIQVAKKLTGLRGPVVVAVALVVGALAAGVYARASWPRLWLRYLTPAPLVFALVFLLVSPTSQLVLPARAEASSGPAPAPAGRQPHDPVRRVPAQLPAGCPRPGRPARVPELRRLRRPVELVPQRHRDLRLHPLGAAGHGDRQVPVGGQGALLDRVPRQPIHAVWPLL